jgi:hypothetical protein
LNPSQAYVLVQTQPEANGIVRALRDVPGVILAEDLRGPYDAIALADTHSSGRTLEGVVADIRGVPGVIRALLAPLGNSSILVRDSEAA